MADKPNTTNPSDGPFATLGELIDATNSDLSQHAASPETRERAKEAIIEDDPSYIMDAFVAWSVAEPDACAKRVKEMDRRAQAGRNRPSAGGAS